MALAPMPRTPAMRGAAGAAIVAAALGACAAGSPVPPVSLAGTQWELVAIQSMDDAQGTTRIATPERYTASFAADGRVAFRLDCNRGSATWKAEPSSEATSGALTFGPVAATRALCPPPSVDARVTRDLAFVRSYLFKDGRLFMSLMADGGIYEWRPVKP
jgi:heat shock protein HslJ